MDWDASAAAEVLIIGALIRILEAPPSADIVDKDTREVYLPVPNVLNHLGQGIAPLEYSNRFCPHLNTP
jgi:hypothetical protein